LASLRRDRELVELAREAAYEMVDPDITLTKQPELRAELSMFLRPEDEEFLFKS
jgi:ATP-dependent DNA helicase RecG